jgi:2-aminoethylphosphonate transport system permease protein
MIVFSTRAKVILRACFAVLFALMVVLPVAVIVVAAFATSWNGVLPSGLTSAHVAEALGGDDLASLRVSVETAIIAAVLAVVVGTWAAVAARTAPRPVARTVDVLFHLPVSVPSVVVGLGLLIAFSKPPLLLNGTAALVVLAQTVLVLSFAYSTVSAAVLRLDPEQERVAFSLGASRARVLTRVTLPALRPAIGAAAGLAVALCMGELGATIMVYPASWRTMPISIFTASDRGDLYSAAAGALLLIAVTFVAVTATGTLVRRARTR